MQQFSRSLRHFQLTPLHQGKNIIFMSLKYVVGEKCEKKLKKNFLKNSSCDLFDLKCLTKVFHYHDIPRKANIQIDVDLCVESLVLDYHGEFLR